MKNFIKYVFMIMLSLMFINISIFANDEIDRRGVSYGLGLSVLGGCWREEIYDDMSNVIGHGNRQCLAIPLPNVSVGYGFSPQFKLNFESKTLVLAGTLELKGQYYLKDAHDTFYLHGGVMGLYAIDYGAGELTGGLGFGYAKGHMEYELGVIHPSSDSIFSLSVKYIF